MSGEGYFACVEPSEGGAPIASANGRTASEAVSNLRQALVRPRMFAEIGVRRAIDRIIEVLDNDEGAAEVFEAARELYEAERRVKELSR